MSMLTAAGLLTLSGDTLLPIYSRSAAKHILNLFSDLCALLEHLSDEEQMICEQY